MTSEVFRPFETEIDRDAALSSLRDAVAGASAGGPAPDLWPLFEALATGRPLGLVRGANSDLLSAETAAEMQLVDLALFRR